MKSCSLTDIGICREVNQDYVLCEQNEVGSFLNLFLVADGMGGHRGGDFASRFCVETMRQLVLESTQTSIVTTLQEAIKTTNTMLREEAESHEELAGMGTTIVAATIKEHVLYVANIGDSRLYIHKDGELRQITEDHSLVEEMVRNGELERGEARFHPNKNIITRALGGQSQVEADFFEIDLVPGERILMCTDGLTNMVGDDEIEEILTKNKEDLEQTVKELVRRANECGGKDNIAVVLVDPEWR